jgi:hypothetical protein
VTLTLTSGPVIGVTPPDLPFSGEVDGSNPASETLNIANIGGGTLDWTVSDNVTWLSVSPGSGSNGGTVTVSVNSAGLGAGTHNGAVTIAGNATNSPVTIPVTLTLTAPPSIALSPDVGFEWTVLTTAANPAAETLTISNSGGGTLTWNVSDNVSWLTINPTSGSNNGTVSVAVDKTGLALGTYNGTITVSGNAANSPVIVPVILHVIGPTYTLQFAIDYLEWTYKVTVASDIGGMSCVIDHQTTNGVIDMDPDPCQADFPENTTVTLSFAKTGSNPPFPLTADWTGCDSSTATTCTVTLTQNRIVRASIYP